MLEQSMHSTQQMERNKIEPKKEQQRRKENPRHSHKKRRPKLRKVYAQM